MKLWIYRAEMVPWPRLYISSMSGKDNIDNWSPTDRGRLSLASTASTVVKVKETVRLRLLLEPKQSQWILKILCSWSAYKSRFRCKNHRQVIFKHTNAFVRGDNTGRIKPTTDTISDLYYRQQLTESAQVLQQSQKTDHLSSCDPMEIVNNKTVMESSSKVVKNFSKTTSKELLVIVRSYSCAPRRTVQWTRKVLCYIYLWLFALVWGWKTILKNKSDIFQVFLYTISIYYKFCWKSYRTKNKSSTNWQWMRKVFQYVYRVPQVTRN